MTPKQQQQAIDVANQAYMVALYAAGTDLASEQNRLALAQAFLALCAGTRLEAQAQAKVARHERRIAALETQP